MKGYYIFAPVENGATGKYSGIEKKIKNFCLVMREKVEINLDILPACEQGVSRLKRIIKRWIPWLPIGQDWGKLVDRYSDADFLYIRKAEHDASFIRFLRIVKEKNPNLKILYEMPTYPYEKERKITLRSFPIFIKDRFFRKSLKKYVDRIVTFYNQAQILGIQTICIMNGYNFSSCKPADYSIQQNTVHMIEVSTTAFWHGYDRIIEGMHLYYKNKGEVNFVFHMVGPVMAEHREMVRKYGIQKHVIFHGKKSGADLEAIYSQCSIGVDVLGGHRKDYPMSSSLKSREYAEKGIPVITSSPIDYLPENYPYQMLCSYDDTPVDMKEVARFHNGIFGNNSVKEVAQQIQMIARERCDFHVTLKPILDYLYGGNE